MEIRFLILMSYHKKTVCSAANGTEAIALELFKVRRG